MHVGMNRTRTDRDDLGDSVPHARGDEPVTKPIQADMAMRSPCTWG